MPFADRAVERPPSKDRLPDADELDLLRALVAEESRQAVAARLCYSERHVRRLVQNLLSRLDVSSTHAAVAIAVSEGWIPPPEPRDDRSQREPTRAEGTS